MKRVVVTGATSMIGVALIEKCIHNHVEVLALVRSGSSKLQRLPNSKYIQVKWCDLEQLDEFADFEGNYDVFYHLGWGNTDKVNRLDSKKQMENVKYAIDAVFLAERMGCKKFIGAGSQAEYGPIEGEIDENTHVNPQIAYGVAKYAANRLCSIECQKRGIQFVWARIFSVYGPLDNEGTMVRYAIETLQKGEKAIFSSGKQNWDYLYSDDAGNAMYLLGAKAVEQGIYCVASGEVRTIRDFVEMIRRAINTEGEIVFVEDGKRPIGICPNNYKLKRNTDFEPYISFEEGIKLVSEAWQNT